MWPAGFDQNKARLVLPSTRAYQHRVGKARHFGLLLGGNVKANDTPGAMNGRALPYTNFFSPSIRLRIVLIRGEAMSAFRSRNAGVR
jgi:hypothetical protein